MRRHLAIVTLAGLLGLAFSTSDAQACHRNRNRCGNRAQVCYQPCQPQRTCGARRGHHNRRRRCHRRAQTACAPIYYAAPVVYAAPQTYAAPQATPQAAPQAPAKAAPQS